MAEIFKYALENIWARKSRSFLTVLSIFIGIATIFIFASFGWGLYDYVNTIAEESGLDKFMVQTRSMGAPGLDDAFVLEEKDLKAIQRTRGVAEVAPFYMQVGEVEFRNERKYVFASGYRVDAQSIALIEETFGVGVDEGRQLSTGDKGRVVLGYNYRLIDKIFSVPLKVGDVIKINDKKFDVIGFFEEVGNPQDDSNLYLSPEGFEDLFGTDASYAMIMGRVNNIEDIDTVVENVKKRLRNVRDQEEGNEDFFVQSFQDALEMFTNVLNIVIGFIFLIVVISGIVASVNTANTMITSVLERVQEIGVMKAIGARNSKIRNIFLIESSILGFVAGVLGVIIGWLFSFTTGRILDNLGWGFLSPNFSWVIFAICIGVATLVGTVSGVAPAIYASKQNVVDALRYE